MVVVDDKKEQDDDIGSDVDGASVAVGHAATIGATCRPPSAPHADRHRPCGCVVGAAHPLIMMVSITT